MQRVRCIARFLFSGNTLLGFLWERLNKRILWVILFVSEKNEEDGTIWTLLLVSSAPVFLETCISVAFSYFLIFLVCGETLAVTHKTTGYIKLTLVEYRTLRSTSFVIRSVSYIGLKWINVLGWMKLHCGMN